MRQRRAALGLKVRTGRAVVVAVGGAVDAPEILVKTRIDVAFTFDEGAVYHVAQGLSLDAARTFLSESEARFVERARKELAALREGLDAKLVAASLVAPPPKPAPPLETILKAHPLVHAAEGELYRRVFSEASAALGARPSRVAEDALAKRAASELGLTPAKLATRLAALGKASGRPWTAEHKQATLAAWLALAAA
jgi:hypothetical protein